MIKQKREIVLALLGSILSNLKFCSASVLNSEELSQGLTDFRKEPVAVTSERLLRYLTFEEESQLAENARQILGIYGGMWITPDIHLGNWRLRGTGRPGWIGTLPLRLVGTSIQIILMISLTRDPSLKLRIPR
jgi:hypothetical protein